MQATSAQPDLALSPEVMTFCERRHLLTHLRVALRLAMRLFDVSHERRVAVSVL
jgi:hypothetical protein